MVMTPTIAKTFNAVFALFNNGNKFIIAIKLKNIPIGMV
jgi:hypothetical protein